MIKSVKRSLQKARYPEMVPAAMMIKDTGGAAILVPSHENTIGDSRDNGKQLPQTKNKRAPKPLEDFFNAGDLRSDYMVLQGDAYDQIDALPDNSVDLFITSPPYWGL